MPSFYLKQPNGKYALFSTIVDDFCAMDMTRQEAMMHARAEMGDEQAARKIERADRDENAAEYDEKAPAGLRRWWGALSAVGAVHGDEARRKRMVAGEVKP